MRTPIGFKQSGSTNTLTTQATQIKMSQALHCIAVAIDKQMRNQAQGGAKNLPFSKFNGKDLLKQLDKLYTKLYEPL